MHIYIYLYNRHVLIYNIILLLDKVIDAWTIALQTMKIGEVAEIITSYKYGKTNMIMIYCYYCYCCL